MEVSVDHEVHAKDLEVVALALGVDQGRAGPDGVRGHLLHLGVNLFIEAVFALVLSAQVLLKIRVGDLVALLVFAVLGQVLLDRIVGQVHIGQRVLNRVLEGSGPDVAIFIPVSLDAAVDRSDHHIVPDVELSALVQEWLLYVTLDDVGLEVPIVVPLLLLQDRLYLL